MRDTSLQTGQTKAFMASISDVKSLVFQIIRVLEDITIDQTRSPYVSGLSTNRIARLSRAIHSALGQPFYPCKYTRILSAYSLILMLWASSTREESVAFRRKVFN